jgi:hypothetical protein
LPLTCLFDPQEEGEAAAAVAPEWEEVLKPVTPEVPLDGELPPWWVLPCYYAGCSVCFLVVS